MCVFICIMFGLFFLDDQNCCVCECIDVGYNFVFLMSDGGGLMFVVWCIVVCSDDYGFVLIVDKVWGIEVYCDCMVVVVVCLFGVMFLVVYFVWFDEYWKLICMICGVLFFVGNLQFVNVGGQVCVVVEDCLWIGGFIVFNKYLIVVWLYFVCVLMVYVGWFEWVGCVEFDVDVCVVYCFIVDVVCSQIDDVYYSFGKVQCVFVIKLLLNEFLIVFVCDGKVLLFDDQCDLLVFLKMEGSLYCCYYEFCKSLCCEVGS